MPCKSFFRRWSVAKILVLAAAVHCRWIIRALFRERASPWNTQEILTSLKINYYNTRASATQPLTAIISHAHTYSRGQTLLVVSAPLSHFLWLRFSKYIVILIRRWFALSVFSLSLSVSLSLSLSLRRLCSPDPSLSWGNARLAVLLLHNNPRITFLLPLAVSHTIHTGSVQVEKTYQPCFLCLFVCFLVANNTPINRNYFFS